jgi:hypothetical protein
MAAASNGLGFHGFRISAVACVALVVSIAFTSACGPAQETGTGVPTTGSGGGGNGGNGTGGEGGDPDVPCPEGASRDCKVDLGQHGNVSSCFQGVQHCEDGQWGLCSDPAGAPAPPPKGERRGGSGQIPLSLSNPVACGTDPCDPTCQTFDEVPGTPIGAPPQILIAPWETGDYGDLPTSIQTQGTSEPCNEGEDCQFDQYCYNPASGTCAHSKCAAGAGLNAACDSCVAKVCGIDASCCNTPQGTTGTSTCVHDLCITGAALKNTPAPACDPCVATICGNAAFSFCCTTQWTAECVQQVTTLCGKSCATGSWTDSCVDLVKSQCGAYCAKDDEGVICAHDKCYLGDPLDAACDPCVAQVCAIDPFCCSGAWDGKCLQEVATECGETCPAQGDCQPWLPTQTDPDCGSYDLTVGVGCTDAGAPQVPVCNHGTMQAPAGLPVTIYPPAPPGTDVIPNYYAAYGGEPVVLTPAAIEPGDCIDVPLPGGTAEGSQLAVNLPSAPGYDNKECQGSNNFSVWSTASGACATPSCAGATASVKLKKVKLFVSVDKSASNNYAMSVGTRWTQLRSALTSFITDPASDDIAMWMRFWPHNLPGNCPSGFPVGCSSVAANGCSVANADVPNLAGGNDTTLVTAINAITPSGNTPMFPALEGALNAASAFQQANADYIAAVVMVTDGNPSQCTTGSGPISALTSSYYSSYGVRTYIIGIAEVGQTFCEIVAGAGGGKSFFIDLGANIQVEQQVLAALNQIKQDFVSCTLPLPNQQIFDPNAATFTYTPGVGAPVDLVNVGGPGACGAGNGWYYDDPANPTSVTLCPTTCTTVKADPNGKLELSIDCISQYLPYDVADEIYESDCPPGTVPQWGFFAYDTTTPGDSSIEFRVATSPDGVTYDPLPGTATKVASAALGTEICAMGGPAPCPVDLFEELNGLPNAHDKYLKLATKIFPTSDQNQTPTVNNWEVTYSCPDSE